MSITFDGRRITMQGLGGADHVYRIEIDPTQSPTMLDAVAVETQGKASQDPRGRGIYHLEGEQLTLFLAPDNTVARPAAFVAAPGSKKRTENSVLRRPFMTGMGSAVVILRAGCRCAKDGS